MGKLYDNLVRNFENISEEEWEEIESLNDIDPNVIEYVNFVREYFLNKDIENIETLNHLKNGKT